MSISVRCYLVVGFPVYSRDLYTLSRGEAPVCANGHSRQDPSSKFCPEDGKKFEWVDIQTPTPLVLELGRRLDWKRMDQVTDWQDKVNDEVDATSWKAVQEPGFHNISCVQGGGSSTVLAFGKQIDQTETSDRLHDPRGFSYSDLKVDFDHIVACRDDLGFPSDRQVKLYMSLYYG